MSYRSLTPWWALALLFLAGCRAQVAQELLEKELREKEDRIYQLEDQLAIQEAQLEAVRRGATAPNEVDDVIGPRGKSAPRRSTRPEDFKPSDIEVEIPGGSSPSLPQGEPSANSGALRKTSRGAAEPSDLIVRKITLQKALTGGLNTDGQPGDEGILVVVEPRNAAGQVVSVPGKVSVVLLDPASPGPAGKVARWDLPQDEVSAKFRKSPTGPGFQLELLWPKARPEHTTLQLFVRYTNAAGEEHFIEQPIEIDDETKRSRKPEPLAIPTPAIQSPELRPADVSEKPPTFKPANTPTLAPPREGSSPAATSPTKPESETTKRPGWAPFR